MDNGCLASSRTLRRTCALVLLALATTAGPVAAHVTVTPREAAAKSAPQLTLRVPTEKDVPTESIRVEFPAELQVLRLKPTAGWTAEIERNESGRITAITYAGSKISREEYQEFSLIARLPEQPGPIRLKAFQRYAGGIEVAWVNEAEPQPAPTITVTPAVAPATAGSDAFAAPSASASAATTASAPAGSAATGAGWMSGVSLALSVVALVAALRPRRGKAA